MGCLATRMSIPPFLNVLSYGTCLAHVLRALPSHVSRTTLREQSILGPLGQAALSVTLRPGELYRQAVTKNAKSLQGIKALSQLRLVEALFILQLGRNEVPSGFHAGFYALGEPLMQGSVTCWEVVRASPICHLSPVADSHPHLMRPEQRIHLSPPPHPTSKQAIAQLGPPLL